MKQAEYLAPFPSQRKTKPIVEAYRAHSCKSQSGFSLLEIIIAFSILALSLGILLKIFSAGVLTASVAEDYSHAVIIGESIIAKTGEESPLLPTQSSGIENNKYHWQLEVKPYQFYPEPMDKAIAAELFKLIVTVSWDDEGENKRQIELVTLKLVHKEI